MRFTAGMLVLCCAAAASAQSAAPAAPAAAAPPSVPTRTPPSHFLVAAYDVSGVSQLDSRTVEEAVYPFVGPEKTTADVESARKALQDAYAARGFESVQVEIPPQPEASFGQGIVQISVVEAPVGQVTVSGSRYHALDVVRDQVASVQEGKPLNLKSLSTELDDANRFPDRVVTPSFKAGKVPGTIDVDLKVEDTLPLHASVELNNDHSPNTAPLRVNAGVRYSNLWQLGHTASATYIVAPEDRDQTEVFSGSYSAPLLGSPLTFVLYGYYSNSNVAALGGVNVLGKGYQVGGRVVYRLPGKTLYQNVTLGLDYKDFKQNITVGGAPAGTAPIRYIPLYASYGLARSTDKSELNATVAVTAGLRAIKKYDCFQTDANGDCIPTDQFKNKDFNSSENFVHASVDLSYSRAFAHDIVASLRLSGQLADSHLVTNEQVAIGGLSTIRGYLLSEAVGDDGYSGSLELRSPSLASHLGSFVDELRLYAFVDGGQVRVLDPLPDQQSVFSLLSVGGGIRLKMFRHLSSELAVGLPLITASSTPAKHVRTTFSAKGEF